MRERKVKAAIIGPGNIGTDLMYKIMKRSKYMEIDLMIGIYPSSEGLKRANTLGINTSHEGIEAVKGRGIDIAFDATSAAAHLQNAQVFEVEGIVAIDLTPAALGPYVCPVINLNEHIERKNINLITCGGQATIPIVAAISAVTKVHYAEIVATIASRSAGPGTRQNIDEFTKTTARGLEVVGGAERGKAIIILNPAEPPIIMRDTIYTIVDNPDREWIEESVRSMIAKVQEYVPGYRLRIGPLIDDKQVTIMIEVEGAGDFLPTYSGNLDIETSAAVAIGEKVSENILKGKAG
ncbi:MAG: acetaldehyde dehydrogenase [Spirochaetes bacterium DG_61]|jgi:acetaldehyde dehydrogenase|nr:MAG: acetaldehyde dehydrogenase [Spirochaetes bacterium DG_61]